jgi:hypothetical protein
MFNKVELIKILFGQLLIDIIIKNSQSQVILSNPLDRLYITYDCKVEEIIIHLPNE